MNTIELAKECGAIHAIGEIDGTPIHTLGMTHPELEAFAEKIRADERERCAKVCEDIDLEPAIYTPTKCAEAIRNMTAGGEHE